MRQRAFGAIVIGAIAMAIGGLVAYRTISFRFRSSAIESHVVDNVIDYDDTNKLRYFPIVEYTDGRGTTHRKRVDANSSTRWEQGRTFTLRLDPSDPDKPRLSGALEWLFPIIFLIPGALLVILGGREMATH